MSEITPAEAQEIEATGAYSVATLAGTELRVKPVGQWRPSHLRALRSADFDTWAEGALHEDDAQKFIDLDATFDEITAFTSDAMSASGENPGKSGGPSRSRKTTRKR